MKKIFKYLFILTIMFILPSFVLAEETDTTFDYIDINKSVSLKYKVLNNEYSLPNVDATLSGIKLYKLDQNNNKVEITFTADDISEVGDSYRISGEFPKYHDDGTTEVKYLVEYTYTASSVNSNNKDVIYTSSEYSLTSDNNESADEGIIIKLQDSEIVKTFAPKLIINKSLEVGTPDGTFTFSINDQNVTVTTNGASATVGGNGTETFYLGLNTTYVVKEINIPNTYELVSINSARDTDSANDTITVTTTNSLDDEIVINVKNQNKVDHSKNIKDNGDGTHQLSLDVTGENEKSVNKANVVVIFDTSGSMSASTGSGKYIYRYNSVNYDSWNTQFYGLVNGEYVELTRSYNDYNYYYRTGNNWIRYRGQRYTRATVNETRFIAAQEAVKSLAGALLANNILDDDDPNNDDIVKMSLVTFATTAKDPTTPTNIYSTIESSINTTSISTGANGGTNWEAALEKAKTINFGANREATTYYIFVSDGNPTFRLSSHTGWRLNNNGTHHGSSTVANPDEYYYPSYNGANPSWQDNRSQYAGEGHRGSGSTDYYNWNYTDAAKVAKEIVDGGAILYSIGTYGDVDKMEHLANYAYTGDVNTAPQGTYYYDAKDTDELNEALKEILAAIERSGIGSVTINDGTTQSVTASTGVVSNLLSVDGDSFEYWLTFPVTDSNKIKVNDTEVTITNNNGTYRLSWTEGEAEKHIDAAAGSKYSTDKDGNPTFVYKWTGKNQLYNVDPPAATLTNGTVNWTLSKEAVGVLLNNVKYTVTFDVWPSQTTYDYISDLDNGIIKYKDLDPEIQKYLRPDGNGGYYLLTNTTATLTYDDSRDNDPARTTEFVNPEPVATAVTNVSIKKDWKNDLDKRSATSIELYLTRDGEKYGLLNSKNEVLPFVLDKDHDWESVVAISTGLISVERDSNNNITKATVREVGHDYSFEEKPSDAYYWDLVVDTRRPMVINKADGTTEVIMLIKVTDSTEVRVDDEVDEIGSSNYLVKNGNEYFKICDEDGNNCAAYRVATGNEIGHITAINWRRSNLNIVKVVEDNDYKEGTTFKFELTVIDSLSKPTDVRDVWFSIVDKDENLIKTAIVSGATKEVQELVENDHIKEIHVDEEAGTVSYKYDGKLYVVDFAGYNEEGNPTYYTYYYYAPSGTKITVDLEPTWNLRFINLPNGSTYTFTEIQTSGYEFVSSLSRQNTITSRVNDNTNKKYTVNGSINEYNTSYLVTYTNKHVVTDIEVIKVWSNDTEENRPESITVRLYADGTEVDHQSLTGPTWSYKWENMDKYNEDGSLIVYTVTEDSLDDYYTIVDGYTITNTYKYITIPVKKEWSNTPEDKRANVIVKIKSIETALHDYHAQTTLRSTNNWSDAFTVLKYILNNNNELVPITYGVEEVAIEGIDKDDAGIFIDYNDTIHAIVGRWTSVVTGDMNSGYVITNTYEPITPKTIVLVKKSFNGNALEGAEFVLYKYIGNGESGATNINPSAPGANWLFMQRATSDSDGEFVFDGLYDANGNLILQGLYAGEYRLIETKAPTNCILPKGQWILFLELSNDESEVVINKDKSTSTDEAKTPALLIHKDGGSVDIEVYNEEIPDIPSTGGIGIPHNNKYGLLLMILGIGIYLYNLVNQRKQIKNFN